MVRFGCDASRLCATSPRRRYIAARTIRPPTWFGVKKRPRAARSRPCSATSAMPKNKWLTIGVLVTSALLSMGVWFSASAVVPALAVAWNLDDGGRAWLTLAVQAGFAIGALVLAILNLADRARPDRLMALSALVAALA